MFGLDTSNNFVLLLCKWHIACFAARAFSPLLGHYGCNLAPFWCGGTATCPACFDLWVFWASSCCAASDRCLCHCNCTHVSPSMLAVLVLLPPAAAAISSRHCISLLAALVLLPPAAAISSHLCLSSGSTAWRLALRIRCAHHQPMPDPSASSCWSQPVTVSV